MWRSSWWWAIGLLKIYFRATLKKIMFYRKRLKLPWMTSPTKSTVQG